MLAQFGIAFCTLFDELNPLMQDLPDDAAEPDGRWPKWQTYSPVEAAVAGTPLGNNCLSSWPQRGPPGSVPAAGICFL